MKWFDEFMVNEVDEEVEKETLGIELGSVMAN